MRAAGPVLAALVFRLQHFVPDGRKKGVTTEAQRHREPERITTKTRRTQRELRRAKRAKGKSLWLGVFVVFLVASPCLCASVVSLYLRVSRLPKSYGLSAEGFGPQAGVQVVVNLQRPTSGTFCWKHNTSGEAGLPQGANRLKKTGSVSGGRHHNTCPIPMVSLALPESLHTCISDLFTWRA